MKYVNAVLQKDEQIKYEGTITWAIYIPYAFVLFIMMLGANDGSHWAALIVFAAILLPFPWMHRRLTEIAITDRRIVLKVGLISRRSIEMNMDKVESVDVKQSILGRMFNYATVIIHGTGGRNEPLRYVDSPLELRSHIIAR